jgi:hypothetical protein
MIICLLACSISVLAQTKKDVEPKEQFSMFYGNDVSAQKDMYYTNGWAFEYVHPIFSKSPFNINFFKKGSTITEYSSARLIYDVFTPDLHKELLTDRPFAAYVLFGSKHQYVNHTSNVSITSELQFGVIGQAAGADVLQNGLHKIMPSANRVEGWESQIKNDIAVNYIFKIEKQFFKLNWAEMVGGTTAYLGTPYTKAEVNYLVRIGMLNAYFDRLNLSSQNNWQLFLFGEIKGSYVLHNATIQGGLLNPFNTYVRSDLTPFVMDFQIGIGSVYKKYGINFGQHFLTKEFDAGNSHSWGYFLFTITI